MFVRDNLPGRREGKRRICEMSFTACLKVSFAEGYIVRRSITAALLHASLRSQVFLQTVWAGEDLEVRHDERVLVRAEVRHMSACQPCTPTNSVTPCGMVVTPPAHGVLALPDYCGALLRARSLRTK